MGKNIWRQWAPYHRCIKEGNIRKKRPKGLSYSGISEYGTFYYRKSDKSTWIEATFCSDGSLVFVKE